LKHLVPQGRILRLLFIICINDLPLRVNSLSEPLLLVDGTSVIISSSNFESYSSFTNLVLPHLIKWFVAYKLVLNIDKPNIMQFITKNLSHSTLHIGYKAKNIEETEYKISWFTN